ncbi:MAG TPA: outer membrane protein assembly factor BamD [Terriglobales bacterium]|jgi:outer membrane protein assembly factor BamD|nr:outer membrane protein assembly factor BamD [Terriglobales bacterium]
MSRRIPIILLLGVLAFSAACTNKKVKNPLADVGSKQPDKVLFDRAMDALKHNRFDVARLTLQTLINTYPDSEYIARAKLGVADSWYAEGGSAALTQAEIEYKDFITFFPNMPEAAEAQLKIANIHYQQMEKPDRDFTHAARAEEEYRNLILQWPDSKLLPEAKQRLLEVQEVLAEREFRVARFYYLRQSYPASIARLRSVVDKYPLYSRADEALYLLGQSYEGEIANVRLRKGNETAKARFIEMATRGAAEAYSRILTRYPLMDRADDAKARLIALKQPVPKPTREAVLQNKAEEDSRRQTGILGSLMNNFRKHPDVSQSARVGEPTLVDPKMVSATDVVQQAARAMMPTTGGTGTNTVSVETVKSGAPLPNEAAPRSDQPAAASDSAQAPGAPPAPGELTPNVSANDANELKPNVPDNSAQTLPPPAQVNEIQATPAEQNAAEGKTGDKASSAKQSKDDDVDAMIASSKHKKKKGLKKIIPF